jgi:hypothetical protein
MEKHKRFLVFKYDNFYPCGGTNDLQGSFDSLSEATDFANGHEPYRFDYFEIYDRIEGVTIEKNEDE